MLLPVLLGSVALFGFGAFWFTFLFGRTWAKLMGFTTEQMSPEEQAKAKAMGMTKPLILNFLTNVLLAWVVYYIYPQIFAFTYAEFLKVMFVIWLGFSFPIYANAAIWERKSWKLVAINSAQSVLALVIVTAIIYYFAQ